MGFVTGPTRRPRGRRIAPRTRPRYLRIVAAGGSTVVTTVAILAGVGLIPATEVGAMASTNHRHDTVVASGVHSNTAARLAAAPTTRRLTPSAGASPGAPSATAVRPPGVPADSGTGRRIVFDIPDQRVWLVAQNSLGKDVVSRTYLVSGSKTDNLQPGTYSVYSRSLHALGIDDSGTMTYMVRFAHGATAPIGFHDIPIFHGKRVQTRAQLGRPESHGCVRQWRPDAKALWAFAPLGTKVVVLA